MADNKVYKIASVCGSGYATSGWIKMKLTEEFFARGILADVVEVKVMDLPSIASNFDLIVSASKLNDVYGVPIVSSSSIITGMGYEKTLEEIINKLNVKKAQGEEDE